MDGLTKIFDSDLVRGGICVGQYAIGAGESFSRSFPLLQGATLRASNAAGRAYSFRPGASGIAVNNSGVPSVSAGPISVPRTLLIWADGTPAVQSAAGIQALNDQYNVALSPQGRGLVYIGKATYTTLVPATTGGVKESPSWLVRVSSPTLPIAVVDLSGGIYLRSGPYFRSLGGGIWEAEVVAVASRPTLPAASVLTPDVYCFALPPVPSGGGPQAALYDEDGSLAYDLLAGRMLFSSARVDIAGSEVTATTIPNVTRSIPSMAKVGVFGAISYRRENQRGANSSTGWEGFWTLSGTQLSLVDGCTYLDIDAGTVSAANLQPKSDGAFAELIDLSQY